MRKEDGESVEVSSSSGESASNGMAGDFLFFDVGDTGIAFTGILGCAIWVALDRGGGPEKVGNDGTASVTGVVIFE